jgi:hypothetical protein
MSVSAVQGDPITPGRRFSGSVHAPPARNGQARSTVAPAAVFSAPTSVVASVTRPQRRDRTLAFSDQDALGSTPSALVLRCSTNRHDVREMASNGWQAE